MKKIVDGILIGIGISISNIIIGIIIYFIIMENVKTAIPF